MAMTAAERSRKFQGTWTTEKELDFLDTLGREDYKIPGKIPRSRLELLRLYKRAMRLRREWCGIEPETIQQYLDNQLDEDNA
jgi:hypothetical protein